MKHVYLGTVLYFYRVVSPKQGGEDGGYRMSLEGPWDWLEIILSITYWVDVKFSGSGQPSGPNSLISLAKLCLWRWCIDWPMVWADRRSVSVEPLDLDVSGTLSERFCEVVFRDVILSIVMRYSADQSPVVLGSVEQTCFRWVTDMLFVFPTLRASSSGSPGGQTFYLPWCFYSFWNGNIHWRICVNVLRDDEGAEVDEYLNTLTEWDEAPLITVPNGGHITRREG